MKSERWVIQRERYDVITYTGLQTKRRGWRHCLLTVCSCVQSAFQIKLIHKRFRRRSYIFTTVLDAETPTVAAGKACWKFLRSGYQIDARFFQVGISGGCGGVWKIWVGSGWRRGWCLLGLTSIQVGSVLGWLCGRFGNCSIMKCTQITQNYCQHFSGRVRKSIDCRAWNCLGRPRWGFGGGSAQPTIMRCVTGSGGDDVILLTLAEKGWRHRHSTNYNVPARYFEKFLERIFLEGFSREALMFSLFHERVSRRDSCGGRPTSLLENLHVAPQQPKWVQFCVLALLTRSVCRWAS